LGAVADDPHQYLFYTDPGDFDWLMLANRRKQFYLRGFREFLDTYQPDLVHFQHTLFLGVDIILATRQALPRAPIVYTLHEYLPICHRNGQMIRTLSDELCVEASPRRCHACFPNVPEQAFFLRKRFIASHLARVDQFLAPSHFLLERFVEWGIPRLKIQYEEYGRLPMQSLPERHSHAGRNRIAFFGQLTPYKGVTVLLEAMKILAEEAGVGPVPHLWVHGSNLEFFSDEFQEKTRQLLAATRTHVTLVGPYEPSQLPQLMADIDWVVVPSIWWENSPLVIQEAFAHGRPVICSDIGGMAEKVTHEVNGLHFRTNDPFSLADTIRRAVGSPGLWENLLRGIPPAYPMTQHVARLERIYRGLLDVPGPL
jgi:glycosyltransferase involved in cell wall biosynthesis